MKNTQMYENSGASPIQPLGSNKPTVDWKKLIKPYITPSNARSWWQVASTVIPYLICTIFAYQLMAKSFLLAFPLMVLGSLFLVRTFIIMHDCGHGSYFKSKKLRTLVGYITGFLCFTPYWQWTQSHATHHKHSGNLDKRGVGDIWLLTVGEYEELSTKDKMLYRLYRHPIVTFIIGPFWLFIVSYRFFMKTDGKKEKRSVIITNIYIITLAVIMSSLVGFKTFLIVQLLMLYMAQFMGVWMFYVQHQYEGVYWKEKVNWNYYESAMLGSSYFKLPKVMQWFTGNIGFHHIHHLSHSIPNYNLEKCMRENPEFQNPTTLTMFSSLKCMFLNIYDEKREDLISFRTYNKRYRGKKAA